MRWSSPFSSSSAAERRSRFDWEGPPPRGPHVVLVEQKSATRRRNRFALPLHFSAERRSHFEGHVLGGTSSASSRPTSVLRPLTPALRLTVRPLDRRTVSLPSTDPPSPRTQSHRPTVSPSNRPTVLLQPPQLKTRQPETEQLPPPIPLRVETMGILLE